MPVGIVDELPVSSEEAGSLWRAVCEARGFNDDQINVRVVDEEESKGLNKKYRGKEKPTNVLTFSYSGEHDIALCLEVAEREAAEIKMEVRDYVAWLLAHGFLHATGMDHERGEDEREETRRLEKKILEECGFYSVSPWDRM